MAEVPKSTRDKRQGHDHTFLPLIHLNPCKPWFLNPWPRCWRNVSSEVAETWCMAAYLLVENVGTEPSRNQEIIVKDILPYWSLAPWLGSLELSSDIMKLRTCRGKDQQQDHTRGVWFSVAIRPIALLVGLMGLYHITFGWIFWGQRSLQKRTGGWSGVILAESEDSNGEHNRMVST